jgi:Uma2 family endonuclease
MPEPPVAAFIELAPGWVCEVLSLSIQALDRSDKMDVYARAGIRTFGSSSQSREGVQR